VVVLRVVQPVRRRLSTHPGSPAGPDRSIPENQGLDEELGDPRKVRSRVRLPLVRCAHAASPEEELTPDRAAQLLLREETDELSGT
jgi:hypothetical protein